MNIHKLILFAGLCCFIACKHSEVSNKPLTEPNKIAEEQKKDNQKPIHDYYDTLFLEWVRDTIEVMKSIKNPDVGLLHKDIIIDEDSSFLEHKEYYSYLVTDIKKISSRRVADVIEMIQEQGGKLPSVPFNISFLDNVDYYRLMAIVHGRCSYNEVFENILITKDNKWIEYSYMRGRIDARNTTYFKDGKKVTIRRAV